MVVVVVVLVVEVEVLVLVLVLVEVGVTEQLEIIVGFRLNTNKNTSPIAFCHLFILQTKFP